jgi:hypothetical protein
LPKPFYLFTALWDVDTKIEHGGRTKNEVRHLDPMGRYRTLATVLQKAWRKMLGIQLDRGREILSSGADWLYLFVAPEYLFAASDKAHAVPQDTKETIVQSLMALSGHYPNLILVPGTIAWKKPVIRSKEKLYKKTRLEKYLERVQAAEKADIAAVHRDTDRKIKQRIAQNLEDKEQVTRLQSEEYRSMLLEAPLADVTRAKQRYGTMVKNLETAKEKCFIARNTAYGFHRGREVARYHKRGEYMEVFKTESEDGYVIYEPGGGPEGAGDRFAVESVKFGIEVCLDHQLGFLSTSSGATPDVHIIMSADTPLVSEHKLVANGGYVVHASSNPDYTGVWRNYGGKLAEEKTIEEDAGVGRLRYATLELQITRQTTQGLFPDD